MLQRFEFEIVCMESGHVIGSVVEKLHGALFSWLKEWNPSTATSIHDVGKRSFVITSLESTGPIIKHAGQLQLEKGSLYRFRVHSLDTQAFEALQALSECIKGKSFFLNNATVRVDNIHPLDTPISYAGIMEQAIHKIEQRKWNITFLTPTSFRRQRQQQLFPLPELVFGSLLKTEMLRFSDYKVIGFKGKVVYLIPKDIATYTRIQVAALSLFAGYAGIGYKTTMGMGQVHIE
ncbi:CRISPR system precrRNA processing endoribonuclease RAMP protein Cas6 [Aneurinibacillus sp. UBA3580]|uniref:CRISPR system precrRNA processing endoribonuclease RAMP protein Cas6 n=1 Tax=Aneurinibacillus sp. UBA3580 TaxID=1946041 RepID=UPI00257BB60D|nr:CRISPR system precrRNA processing endoribonuclease RAMP protein Cas6 [Aneurinibacillus sp. UBA3580]